MSAPDAQPASMDVTRLRRGAVASIVVGVAMIWLFLSDLPVPGLAWYVASVLIVAFLIRLRSGGMRMSARVADEQLQLAVQLAMIEIMLADGGMGAEELRKAGDIHRELTSVAVPEGIIEAQARLARSDGDDLAAFLGAMSSELSTEDRRVVLEAAVRMAVGDGEFAAAERPALAEMTGTLELTPEDLREVVVRVQRREPGGSAGRSHLIG